jgi:hypothetical protein
MSTSSVATLQSTSVNGFRGETLIAEIKELIQESGINTNEFYRTFRRNQLDPSTLKLVFQQYYYYIRTFPQILAGLSARVDSELIRMKRASRFGARRQWRRQAAFPNVRRRAFRSRSTTGRLDCR